MIGRVDDNLEARLTMRLRSPAGEAEIEAVIDPGFTDYLLLPAQTLARLGTVSNRRTEAILGDGSEVQFDLHLLDVLWDDEWRTVRAFAGEGGALVGISMLIACDLHVRFLPDGEVRVEPV